ncbi:hypothetical protein RB597_008623 [Gaeumannomyces tritici]
MSRASATLLSTARHAARISTSGPCRPRVSTATAATAAAPALALQRQPGGRAAAMSTKMLQANRLREAMGRGPSMGLWQMLPGANISRALARTPGVDFIVVDCEHGTMDDAAMHNAVPAIAAAGISPIVRVPDFQGWMVKRALDSGAHGILVPLIRTVKEVEQLVSSAKFPPQGTRGFGSPFAMQNFHPLSMTEYLQQANASLLTAVQIETREALEAVEEIAPLVDVLFVGPFDLGNNIGHPVIDGKMDPELDAAIDRVRLAAERTGTTRSGIFCTGGEQARRYAEQGFRMLSVATDITGLQAAMAESVAVAKGEAKPDRSGRY